MERYNNVIQDAQGNVITTATVTVYEAGTLNLAAIKQDDEVTGLNNPFTVADINYDTNGTFWFKAADGAYDIKVVNGVDTNYIYATMLFDPVQATLLKNKLDGTVPPGATDDSNAGYAVGSFWVDTVGGEAYRCVDATPAAAVWLNTTLELSELGGMALQDPASVAITGGTLSNITSLGVIGTLALIGNMTVTGTIDGRDISVDGAKLDTIAANATPRQDWGDILGTLSNQADLQAVLNTIPAGIVSTADANAMWINALEYVGLNQADPQNRLHISEPGATSVYAQFTNLTSGHTATDGIQYGLDSAGNGYVYLRENGIVYIGTNNITRAHFEASGGLTILTPTAGIALNVSGVSNQLVINATGGATSGQSYGIKVRAGTTSADYGIVVNNYADTITHFKVDGVGNAELGISSLATTATDGFPYIPTCAGTPTGTPTTKTGKTPMVYDTTNDLLYMWTGAAWAGVGGGGGVVGINSTANADGIWINSSEQTSFGANVHDSLVHMQLASAGTVTAPANTVLTVENSTNTYITLLAGTTSTSGINFNDSSGVNGSISYNHNTNRLSLYGGGVTRFNADATGAGINVTPTGNFTIGNTGTSYIANFYHTHATTPYGIYIQYSGGAPNSGLYNFITCVDTGATRMAVYSNGNLANVTGVYGTISDETMKQDIVPAQSQWNDVKAIGLIGINYRFKADVKNEGDNAKTLLGWSAQKVEKICPGLVMTTDMHVPGKKPGTFKKDKNGNEVFVQKKAIRSSVLFTKAVMALAEAMERIEKLEEMVADLKLQLN